VQNVKEVVELLCNHLSNRLESSYFGSMKCFYFGTLKMKMWIGCHCCSFVIPSKGP
jgi:hypothetical protein